MLATMPEKRPKQERRWWISILITVGFAVLAWAVTWGATAETVQANSTAIGTLETEQKIQAEHRGYVRGKLESIDRAMQRIEKGIR